VVERQLIQVNYCRVLKSMLLLYYLMHK